MILGPTYQLFRPTLYQLRPTGPVHEPRSVVVNFFCSRFRSHEIPVKKTLVSLASPVCAQVQLLRSPSANYHRIFVKFIFEFSYVLRIRKCETRCILDFYSPMFFEFHVIVRNYTAFSVFQFGYICCRGRLGVEIDLGFANFVGGTTWF